MSMPINKIRAISFWQYQIYQEKLVHYRTCISGLPRGLTNFSAFQQAVVRNVNDKNAQLQKQLENVLREGQIACAPY